MSAFCSGALFHVMTHVCGRYGQYLDRRGKTVQQERRKRPKQLLAEAESEWWKDQTEVAPPEAADMTKDVFADSDDEGRGPVLERTSALVMDMPKQKPVRSKVVNRWLSNPGLDSLLGDDDDVDDDTHALPKRAGKKGRKDVQEEKEEEEVVFGPAPPAASRKSGGSSAGGGGVNMLATQDSDSDTSYDDDPESMAEIAAMGAALLRKTVRKEDIVDSSYHRFAFSDSGM